MYLATFFAEQYKPRKLHGKSVGTDRLYRVCFANLSRTLGREPLLTDLNNAVLLKHMQRLLDLGRTKATANRERCCMVAIWRFAAQRKLLDEWPEIQKLKEPIRVPKAWLREELQALLDAAARMDREPLRGTTIPMWLWWSTLLRVLLDTGERIGAIRETKWEWINGSCIVVPAEVRKGGKRDKFFTLSPETQSLLKQIREISDDRKTVFPWHYSDTYLWNRYRKLLESAGLPTGRNCAMHRLRKTVASVAHQAGADAQQMMDHSSPKITREHYIDPRYSRASQTSQIVADWLRNPPSAGADRKHA